MIERVAREKAFYFSYELDLTKNLQKSIEEATGSIVKLSSGNSKVEPKQLRDFLNLYPNSVDPIQKFAFNAYLLKEYDQLQYCPFRVPCIHGFVYIRPLSMDNLKFDFALISRKDSRRAGRRFIVRGLDREGNAANFVETEQIITVYDQGLRVAALVQTRGSIPVIWSQKPNLKYNPTLKINPNFEESIFQAKKHVTEMQNTYGKEQVFVNLVDKKGSQ